MPANYGLINTLATGLREGLTTAMTMRNMNRQQQQTDLENKIRLAQSGMQEDENGGLSYNPLQQQKMQLQQTDTDTQMRERDPDSEESKNAFSLMKNSMEQAKPGSSRSLPEKMSAAQVKELYPIVKTDVSGVYGLLGKQAAAGAFAAPRIEANTQRVHQNAINEIEKDPTAKSLMTTYQNLDNAEKNFSLGGATPQEFSELQQAVRSNLGLKGAGGVGEREETYLKSLGLNAAKIKQFISGDPQDVRNADPEMVSQVQKIVELEKDNKRKQVQGLIDAKSKGHASFYKQHPEEAEDYENVKNGFLGQFSPAEAGAATQYDPDVLSYAKAHNISPDQAQAIKLQRTRGK